MKIDTKFNIRDKVWLLLEGKPVSGIVENIEVEVMEIKDVATVLIGYVVSLENGKKSKRIEVNEDKLFNKREKLLI